MEPPRSLRSLLDRAGSTLAGKGARPFETRARFMAGLGVWSLADAVVVPRPLG